MFSLYYSIYPELHNDRDLDLLGDPHDELDLPLSADVDGPRLEIDNLVRFSSAKGMRPKKTVFVLYESLLRALWVKVFSVCTSDSHNRFYWVLHQNVSINIYHIYNMY